MDKGVSKLNNYLTRIFSNKKKKWEEFFKWYRDCIENIDPEVAKKIGCFSHPVKDKDKTGYQIELSLKDYAWWKAISESETWLTLKPISELNKDLKNKMLNIMDKQGDDLILNGDKDAIKEILDYIDDINN